MPASDKEDKKTEETKLVKATLKEDGVEKKEGGEQDSGSKRVIAPSTVPYKLVVVHPLVLLSVVDHYNRVAKDTKKRVVGVLLGEVSHGKVDITNSYAGFCSFSAAAFATSRFTADVIARFFSAL